MIIHPLKGIRFTSITIDDIKILIPTAVKVEHLRDTIKVYYTGKAKRYGKIRLADCILTWHYDLVPINKNVKERIYRIYKLL
jgi:hypothetical protein